MKILMIATLLCSSVSAFDQIDMNRWIEEEIKSQHKTLEDQADSSTMSLKTIRVRARATYSVEIPLLAEGAIRPEIELYWTKK